MPQDRKNLIIFWKIKTGNDYHISKNSPVRRIFIATTNVAKRRSRTVRCQMWKQKNERCGLRDHFFFCKLLIFSTEWSENNAANPTQKGCLLGVPSWLQHFFRLATKKMIWGQKYSIFGSKKGHFGQSGPRSGLPSLRIWETFDPIESGPSEPKKMGVHRWSIKMQNFGPKMHFFFGPKSIFLANGPNILLLSWLDSEHPIGIIIVFTPLQGWLAAGCRGPFCARNSAFFYATPTKAPFFLARTDPTQWDCIKSLVSWGNSG